MITALLTSVNYNDFLDFLLPKNISQFDEIIVLTVESDIECKKVCEKYKGVRCLVFDDSVLKTNGKNFNKGALYNKGLEYLDSINYTDWLVFTDADILFPNTFRKMVENLEKKQRVLYTLNRYDCDTFGIYEKYKETNDLSLLGEPYYCPFAGYCQIFIYEPTKMPVVETGEADVYDWEHLRRFGRPRLRLRKKQDIFKFLSDDEFVLHLGQQLVNINGRVSGSYFEKLPNLKMKLKDWLTFDFPTNEIIVGGSSVDALDSPVEHPIGVAPQCWQTFDSNLLLTNKDTNKHLCYSNLSPKTGGNRKKILRSINRFDYINKEGLSYGQKQKISFDGYFIGLKNHKFCISPEGNGIDCHRHYETILAKGIPIIQIPNEEYSNQRWNKNSCMQKYDNLPILWTTDYTELTEEYLEKKYKEMLETEYDFNKMTITYWVEHSNNLLKNMEFWKQKFFRNDPK
jgi:hypothetical protein